jgi:hypothetical protein
VTDFDRITTSDWTVAFPNNWIDRTKDDGTLYFESPEGDKGFYISLWVMSADERRGSRELVESFQKVELSNLFTAEDTRDLLAQSVEGDASTATGYWQGYIRDKSYLITGKQPVSGKRVLRATFHDYDCQDVHQSNEFFRPIIDSVELRDA